MREPRNCPLPKGWNNRSFDWHELLDAPVYSRDIGRLPPRVQQPKLTAILAAGAKHQDDRRDDHLYSDIAKMKIYGCNELEITQFICGWLSDHGFLEREPTTLDKFNEIMATRWLAENWASHVDAPANRIAE